MDNQLPVRKPLRMSHYDYNTPGAYFLTFCTHNKRQFLSRIVGAIHESPETRLTDCGQVVDAVIQNIPPHLGVTIDQYVIMPNHVHLIAVIDSDDALRAIHELPLRSKMSKLIGYIKMNASKAIRQKYGDMEIWQRGYYDHVIRNREDYLALAEYIQTNPIRWKLDQLYCEE